MKYLIGVIVALLMTLPINVIRADINNGCEIECPNDEHPTTVIVSCPVPKPCPHKNGVAECTVYDYTSKPPAGETPVTKHLLKSVSPCGCVVKCVVCKCIPNGKYQGTCKAYYTTKELEEKHGDFDASTCTYEIKCDMQEYKKLKNGEKQ